MTNPTSGVGPIRNQLWPIPAQMHQYLENWQAYATELERQIEQLKKSQRESEAVLTDRISKLRKDMDALEKPLLEQISELEKSNVQLRLDNDAIHKELNAAAKVLAAALEITGKPLPLLTMVNDAVILVEESKEQFRASL